MEDLCNPHRTKQIKAHLFFFFFFFFFFRKKQIKAHLIFFFFFGGGGGGLSNLHIRDFRTGNFDKYKYELLEYMYHIKPRFTGYYIRGFLTCCIGLVIRDMLKMDFTKKVRFCLRTNEMTITTISCI